MNVYMWGGVGRYMCMYMQVEARSQEGWMLFIFCHMCVRMCVCVCLHMCRYAGLHVHVHSIDWLVDWLVDWVFSLAWIMLISWGWSTRDWVSGIFLLTEHLHNPTFCIFNGDVYEPEATPWLKYQTAGLNGSANAIHLCDLVTGPTPFSSPIFLCPCKSMIVSDALSGCQPLAMILWTQMTLDPYRVSHWWWCSPAATRTHGWMSHCSFRRTWWRTAEVGTWAWHVGLALMYLLGKE